MGVGRGMCGQLDFLCGVSKKLFSIGRMKFLFSVALNIIISHIFPENLKLKFIKLFRRYKIFLFNFDYLRQFWGGFLYFLVTKILITSACNRWCQQHFSFSLLSQKDLLKRICFEDLQVCFSNFYMRKTTTRYIHNQNVAELVNSIIIFSVRELDICFVYTAVLVWDLFL